MQGFREPPSYGRGCGRLLTEPTALSSGGLVNKLDREGRDPFDLLDEIEQSLALDVTPASWPIGMGRDFLGSYNLFADALRLFERGVHDRVTEPIRCHGLDDPQLLRLLPKILRTRVRRS
jgi:peptide chain release factor 3